MAPPELLRPRRPHGLPARPGVAPQGREARALRGRSRLAICLFSIVWFVYVFIVFVVIVFSRYLLYVYI